MSETALELRGLVKRFGSVRALDGASLEVRPGEVHALLGQNGSGKSTLVKVLTGYHDPDGAEVARVWGEDIALPVKAPHELGIAVIHQELALIDTMTVTENLGISTGYQRGPAAPVRWKDERRRAAEMLEEFGMPLHPDTPVGRLSAAERAAVGITRAIRELPRHSDRKQILILDEPTAYLPAEEAKRVMDLMRRVAAVGSSVVFISHRLAEVMAACDRATVLRDGRTVGVEDIASTSPRKLIGLMLGRDIGEFYPDKLVPPAESETLLEARGVSASVLREVSLRVRAGEIVGVTGLVGQGQEELPYVLAGSHAPDAGDVTLLGKALRPGIVGQRLRDGLVLVPANRKRDGLWQDATATENITLPRIGDFISGGFIRPRREAEKAAELMTKLGVRPVAPERPAFGFSGGNQQKIVLAKWLQSEPRVLVLDEPTQGVDAGAKREILELIRDTVAAGAGALLCSSDHEEVAAVAHRVLVLEDGRIKCELSGDEVSEQRILEECHATTDAVAAA